jgi:hypothetical protein
MTTTVRWLVVAVFALAACGAPPDEGTPETTETTPSPPVEATVEPTTPPPDGPLAEVVDEAVGDLAARLRADRSEIEVLRFEEVTWPDGSLGCPQPGEFYTQATVDGYRVVLGFDDRVYLYHAGGDAEPFLCPSDDQDGGHEFVPPPGFDD